MNDPGALPSTEFARVFRSQRRSVRNQLSRMVPAAEVDDLVQVVFVKAARAWPKFRGTADVGTWLHRIAARTAFDHLRSRWHHETRRTISMCAEDAEPPGGPRGGKGARFAVPADAPGRIVRAEMHACIREFIRRLPPEHAEVLALKDLEELTNPAIAARLGISLDAAKIRLHRARKAMRSLLNDGCEFYQTEQDTLGCDRKRSQCEKPGRCS